MESRHWLKPSREKGISSSAMDIFPTILNFIVYFFFCFYLIKSKSYIDKYFISPYEIIIFLGIFCLILLLIFEPITFFIQCDNPVMCYEGHFAGIISGFCKDKIKEYSDAWIVLKVIPRWLPILRFMR